MSVKSFESNRELTSLDCLIPFSRNNIPEEDNIFFENEIISLMSLRPSMSERRAFFGSLLLTEISRCLSLIGM